MYKNLNPAVASGTGLTFDTRPRRSAAERSKTVTMVLLIIAALVFVVGSGIVYLLYTEIARVQLEVINLQAQAGTSAQITKRYNTTLLGYNDTVSQLQFLENSEPVQQYVPTLLQQLQTLAQATHLDVISVKPGELSSLTAKPATTASIPPPSTGSTSDSAPTQTTKKAAPPPYDIQPITLTVSGTYPEVMSFIYQMPHFPKILCLKGVQFTPKPNGPAVPGAAPTEPSLSAVLQIDAYVFDPSADVSTSVSATPALGTISAEHASVDEVENDANGSKSSSGQPTVPSAGYDAPVQIPGQTK